MSPTTLSPPCRQPKGSYHIDGDLVLLAKEMQYDFFKQLLPELEKWKDNYTIFLVPSPRYLGQGCCNDKDHVKNRSFA
jgi:hypothetical protein